MLVVLLVAPPLSTIWLYLKPLCRLPDVTWQAGGGTRILDARQPLDGSHSVMARHDCAHRVEARVPNYSGLRRAAKS
jgi:hypothetical protein